MAKSSGEMVIVDGVRYRAETAKRLGLTPDSDLVGKKPAKKEAADHKARRTKDSNGRFTASAGDS